MSIQPQWSQPPSAHRYGSAPVLATDQRTNSVEVVFAWLLALFTLGYMLPWAIAATRGKSNSVAIAVLNFFTGWTVIGWIASLVMACTAHQVAPAATLVTQVNTVAVAVPGWYPDPSGAGQRFWDGQTWTANTAP